MATERWKRPYRIYEVRCPHCGWPHDFRVFEENLLEDPDGLRGKGPLARVECFHEEEDEHGNRIQRGCRKFMEVVKMEPTVLIWVRPSQ